VYLAKALVIFPGGFGTLDELMEVLTLIQTEKLGKKLPIVLFGREFWNDIIDFQALIKWGTISKDDLDLMYFSDDVDDAFNYLITNIKPNGS
jgi:predicted Rossmann-fold nucleotide-binding protein